MTARILIIEDDPASRELACYLLDAAGYVTLAAQDGAGGAELALREHPDLILCDLQLPVMDGYQLARYLNASPLWRRAPLVALTASTRAGVAERSRAVGFDGILLKPITPQTFRREVESWLPAPLVEDQGAEEKTREAVYGQSAGR